MRVKIIKADDIWYLEDKINEFLCDIDSDKIIDIKYQGVGNHSPYSADRPSAMIIMKR